jgi:hypothetical protein
MNVWFHLGSNVFFTVFVLLLFLSLFKKEKSVNFLKILSIALIFINLKFLRREVKGSS